MEISYEFLLNTPRNATYFLIDPWNVSSIPLEFPCPFHVWIFSGIAHWLVALLNMQFMEMSHNSLHPMLTVFCLISTILVIIFLRLFDVSPNISVTKSKTNGDC